MPNLDNPIVQWVRSFVRARGFDIVWYRPLTKVLAHHGINVVLDVGANQGQFAIELRRQGYRDRLISFEPQTDVFQLLQNRARGDATWQTVNIGLGEKDGELEMNIFAVSDYGSMLQPVATVDTPALIERRRVPVRRLDSVWSEYCKPGDNVFLKLDVQGYEKMVVDGAAGCLDRIAGIQMEMSITPLYEAQLDWEEMLRFMRAKGFDLWKIEKGTWDPATGRESELDGIFFRSKPLKK